MSTKKDNELIARIYTEDCGYCAEDEHKHSKPEAMDDPTSHEEDGENPFSRLDYFLGQLNDMRKDISLGDNADSTIYQEIRHIAEQLMTWCDDQDGAVQAGMNSANPEDGETVLQSAGQNGSF